MHAERVVEPLADFQAAEKLPAFALPFAVVVGFDLSARPESGRFGAGIKAGRFVKHRKVMVAEQ